MPFAGLLALLAVPLWAAGPGWAQERSYDYRVEHSLYGSIGRHRMTVSANGPQLVVEHENRVEIRILFASVYERVARSREVWQDDRLVRFEGTTTEGGSTVPVRAWAQGDQLLIEGPRGRHWAPARTVPAQPSVERVLGVRWFMKVATGQVVEGKLEPGVADTVAVGAEQVPATRYRMTGGVEQEVWFDEDGVWLKWQLERGGGTVTLTRE